MNRGGFWIQRLVTILGTSVGMAIATVHAQAPLGAVGTIQLPKVSGRIDHLAFDTARQRLFVAALENNTLEV